MREKDWARLELNDQGQGISEQDQKKIFDRFERVHSSSHLGGLGLGLYIVNQIVSAPGEGAAYTVKVPLNRPVGEHSISATY